MGLDKFWVFYHSSDILNQGGELWRLVQTKSKFKFSV